MLLFSSIAFSFELTKWQTLESADAIITFPSTHRELATETLYYINLHKPKISKLTGQKSPNKKHILLQDIGMNTNGYANMLNHTLSVFTPAPSSITGSKFHGNWLETVTAHEYFHSLHAHKTSTANTRLKHLVGNFNYHLFTPNIFIEGFAVYQESSLHPHQGRLNDGLFHAMLMTKAKENTLPSLARTSYFQDYFPKGQWYLYGAGFTEYLVQKYGKSSITNFINDASDINIITESILPKYSADKIAQKNFNTSFPALFKTYKQTLKKNAETWKLPKHTPLLQNYWWLSKPLIHNNILYIITGSNHITAPFTQNQRFSILAYNLKTHEKHCLITFYSPPITQGLLLHNNTLYVGITSPHHGFKNTTKEGLGSRVHLRALTLDKTGLNVIKQETLYKGQITAYAMTPNNELLIAIQKSGKHGSLLLSANTQKQYGHVPYYITELERNKNQVFAVANKHHQASSIYEVTLDPLKLTPVIKTTFNESKIHIDKSTLYFTANYGKHYQAYRKDLSTNTIEKLNGPSFMMHPSPYQKKLFYISMNSSGLTLHQTRLIPSPFTMTPYIKPLTPSPLESRQYDIFQSNLTEKKTWQETLKTLSPDIKTPLLSYDSNKKSLTLGGFLYGSDLLGRVQYMGLFYNDLSYINLRSTWLNPIQTSYTQIHTSSDFTLTLPAYNNAYTYLQKIDLSLGIDDKQKIAPGYTLTVKKHAFKNQLKHRFNPSTTQAYLLELQSYLFGTKNQLKHTLLHTKNMNHVIKLPNNLLYAYTLTEATSMRFEYTHRLLSLKKAFWTVPTFIGDIYSNIFYQQTTIKTIKPYYGIELQAETGLFQQSGVIPTLGLAKEQSNIYYYFSFAGLI